MSQVFTPEVISLFSSPVFILTTTLFLLAFFVYFRFSPSPVLKRNGINGPVPSFFYGHYKERANIGVIKYLTDLHKEYGSIVGFYLGCQPQISIIDLDLIKQVTIKDFDYFIDRPYFPDLMRMKGGPRGLLTSRGDVWREARQALSPTFSTSKMRAMTSLIQSSAVTLVDILRKHANTNKSIEFFRTFGSFTMETIFATAFGRLIEIQKGDSDLLTEAASAIFSGATESKKSSAVYVTMLLSNFPWMEFVLKYLARGSKRYEAFHLLHGTAMELIQQRRKENDPVKYKDLLQLMIDATRNDSKIFSDAEIASHSVTFMLAGYETTANALSYTAYLLALNPQIQEKLQAEIDKFYEENPDSTIYQAAQDVVYLDMVLMESLRLYPPAPVYVRECGKTYHYKNITIPKKCRVTVPTFLLHKDPNYWKNPDIFDPMRFTAEEKAKRPQVCHMPFGSGPRNCIGMRFALLEAKIALIETLKVFTFLQAPDTEVRSIANGNKYDLISFDIHQVPLQTTFGITMAPKNGLYLRIVYRNS